MSTFTYAMIALLSYCLAIALGSMYIVQCKFVRMIACFAVAAAVYSFVFPGLTNQLNTENTKLASSYLVACETNGFSAEQCAVYLRDARKAP